jgi:hypothetical protein
MTTIILVLISNILVSMSVHGTNSPSRGSASLQDPTTHEISVRGWYKSPDYGFAVRIPNEFVGTLDPPPLPQHGLRIDLSKDGDEFIWAVGNYNAADYTSAQDAISENLSWLRTEGDVVAVAATVPTHLQRLPAERITIRYRKKGSGDLMIEDYVAALRGTTNGTETGICYQLGLISRADNHVKNKYVFDQVLSSWRTRKPL